MPIISKSTALIHVNIDGTIDAWLDDDMQITIHDFRKPKDGKEYAENIFTT